MGELVQIGTVGEMADGDVKPVAVGGQDILLARVGAQYYAVAGRCPHMGANLARGRLEGTVVTCPRHGSRFDLRDGRVLRWLRGGLAATIAGIFRLPRPLKSYPLRVDGDRIIIEI